MDDDAIGLDDVHILMSMPLYATWSVANADALPCVRRNDVARTLRLVPYDVAHTHSNSLGAPLTPPTDRYSIERLVEADQSRLEAICSRRMQFVQAFATTIVPTTDASACEQKKRIDRQAIDIVRGFQRFKSIDEINQTNRIYRSIVAFANRDEETRRYIRSMVTSHAEYVDQHTRDEILVRVGIESVLKRHHANPPVSSTTIFSLPEEVLHIIFGGCYASIRTDKVDAMRRVADCQNDVKLERAYSEALTRSGWMDNPESIRSSLAATRSRIRTARYATHSVTEGLIDSTDVSALLQTCRVAHHIASLRERQRKMRIFQRSDVPTLGVVYRDPRGVRVRRDIMESPSAAYWPDRPGESGITRQSAQMPSVSCTRPFHMHVGVVEWDDDSSNVVLRNSVDALKRATSSTNVSTSIDADTILSCSNIAPVAADKCAVRMRASLCNGETGVEIDHDVAVLQVNQMHWEHSGVVEFTNYTDVSNGFALCNGFHRLQIQIRPGLAYSTSHRIGAVVIKVAPVEDSLYAGVCTLTATSPTFVLTRKWVVARSTVDKQRRKRRLEWVASNANRMPLIRRALLNEWRVEREGEGKGDHLVCETRVLSKGHVPTRKRKTKMRWAAMPTTSVLRELFASGL